MKKIKIINIIKTIKIIVLLNLLGIIAGAMIVVFDDIDFQRNVIISNDISLYETKKYYYLPN